ncbi:MAG TPA: ABC transporter ATP-binding protein [Limnochordales bacterium]
MSELLVARRISARYGVEPDEPPVRAVDDVSLVLREGESLGIAGESGCGKSTLASVLSLNIHPPLAVTAGELEVAGRRIALDRPGWRRQAQALRGKVVALLPQGAMNVLNPTRRVGDFVYDVLQSHIPGISRKEALRRAAERFEQLSLLPRALEAYPHQLSGGMRQRVVAVVSTLLDPAILIADEPTSALDVTSQRALLKLMSGLLEQRIIRGIIFITHELALLRAVTHRVAIMYAGQVAEVGPTEAVLFQPAHPYTKALMDATIVLETGTRRQRIETIGGQPPSLVSPPPGCRFHPRCPVAMPVCSREAPPVVSVGEGRSAACWWVAERLGQTAAAAERRDGHAGGR